MARPNMCAVLAAILAVAATAASTRAQAPPSVSGGVGSKPNVVVLFADDMGVGDLGVLGHPTISSPNLDKIANGGVRFTAWYSGFHICSPSRAAMMTGRLCVRSGTCGGHLGGVFSNKPVGGLPTNETTMATALKGVGYATAAVSGLSPSCVEAWWRPKGGKGINRGAVGGGAEDRGVWLQLWSAPLATARR